MKIKDYFRRPIHTYCDVQGVEMDVLVDVDYQPPEAHAEEQAEVVEVKNLRGISVMDSMFVAELGELEDRLLAMAHSDFQGRKEDAAAFARQVREETLAVGQAQRGMRV